MYVHLRICEVFYVTAPSCTAQKCLVSVKGLTVCGVHTAKSGVSYDVVNQYSISVVAANLIT